MVVELGSLTAAAITVVVFVLLMHFQRSGMERCAYIGGMFFGIWLFIQLWNRAAEHPQAWNALHPALSLFLMLFPCFSLMPRGLAWAAGRLRVYIEESTQQLQT